jgi:general secretion pathway protein N
LKQTALAGFGLIWALVVACQPSSGQLALAVDQPEGNVPARPASNDDDAARMAAEPAGKVAARDNPLSAISFASLTATRERPLFSRSRRRPEPPVMPPVEARSAPVTAPPLRPHLALVGAIAADGEGIAVFVDESTKGVVRLKTGEGHSGWILRAVTGREATLQRDQETAVFAIANAPAK